MIKKLLLFVVLFSVSLPAFAQMVDTAWVRRYDGPDHQNDNAQDIAVDGFGNVYVTGHSQNSALYYDYATVKYYPSGTQAWVKRYGKSTDCDNCNDFAYAIAVDASGNVYVTGYSYSFEPDSGTIKYDSGGNLIWAGLMGGEDIAVDISGNVYVTGNPFTIRYYSNGDTAWIIRHGSFSGNAIAVDDAGYIYVTGSRDDAYATIKYYPNGDPVWVRTYSGPADSAVKLYTFTGDAADDEFGFSVSGAGDVNNDGYDDLIVGAYRNDAGGSDAGRAYVYSGQTGGLLHTFTGEAAGDYFGFSVSGAGDVNNDGYDDLIVGAPYNDAGGDYAGRAYVYSGQTGGVLHTFTGEAAGDNFGYSVSGAGDVNNDGYDDLIVGADGNDAGGSEAGRAYVYSGQTGGLLHTFTGEAAGDNFGLSVSGAGDVNNDGYGDLIVGAPYNDAGGSEAGRAYVYSGQTGGLLHTFTGEAAGDNFGLSVSGAGDVNNDGYNDLIVGALGNDAGGNSAGRAYVYSGQTWGLLHTFTGEAAYDYFGLSVSGAGDVNNDGYGDLIVGAPYNDAGGDYAGRAYVYSGQTGGLLHTFTGEAASDFFGYSVSGAGDVNNDGYDDLVMGALLNDAGGTDAGRACVYSGQTGGLLHTFTGEAADDWFGYSVSGAGDVNNDGYDDLIVGAYGNDAGGSEAGRAYVYSRQEIGSDAAHAMAVDNSGYVYVTGESYGIGTDYDYATIKYYPNGDTAWIRRYNGPANQEDYANAVAVDNSGNVYVTGTSSGSLPWSQCTTIKYYPNGDTAWVKRFYPPSIGLAMAIDDSGCVYVTGGFSPSTQDYADYHTIKYDPDGTERWVTTYDGPGLAQIDQDVAYAIAVDDSGCVYVTGKSFDDATGYDYATIKYVQRDSCLIPGDVNNDGILSIHDITDLLFYLYTCEEIPCFEQSDANGNCEIDLGDVDYLVNYMFGGGPDPVPHCSNPDAFSDPGDKDTVRLELAAAKPGKPFVIPMSIFNDNTVLVNIPLRIEDTTQVVLDSTVFEGTRGEGILTGIPDYSCEGSSGILIYAQNPSSTLSAGDGISGYLWGHVQIGADTGFVKIDTSFLEPTHQLRFFKSNTYSLIPEFVSGGVTVLPYTCGDVDGNDLVDLADIVYFINYLFTSGDPPECPPYPYSSCADTNGDGEVGLADAVYLINYVLKSGPDPIC